MGRFRKTGVSERKRAGEHQERSRGGTMGWWAGVGGGRL